MRELVRRLVTTLQSSMDRVAPEALVREGGIRAMRARTIVGTSALALAAGPFYVSIYLDSASSGLVLAIATTAIGILATPVVLRVSSSIAVAANWFVAWLAFITVYLSADTGGLTAPGIVWFASLPIAAFALGGPRTGAFWGAAAGAGIVAFHALWAPDDAPGWTVAPEIWGYRELAALLGLISMVSAFSWLFARQQHSAIDKLEAANLSLDRERRNAVQQASARGRFLSAASHDLRTRMSAIVGTLDLLASRDGNDAIVRELVELRRATDPMNDAVEQLIRFARLDSGTAQVHPSCFDVRELCSEVAEVVEASARARRVRFQCDVATSVPATWTTDRDQLRQLLTNIGHDVVRTARGGVVRLSVRRRTSPRTTCSRRRSTSGSGSSAIETMRGFVPVSMRL